MNYQIQFKKYGSPRRRRKIYRIAAALIIAAAVFGGAAFAALYSPVFEIKDFRITCEKRAVVCRETSDGELKEKLGAFFGQTLFFGVPKNKMIFFTNAELTDFISAEMPKITALNVRKNYFKRTLEITYSEREAATIYCEVFRPAGNPPEKTDETISENQEILSVPLTEIPAESAPNKAEEIKSCFYMDKTGVIYESAPFTSGSLIFLIKNYSAGPSAEAAAGTEAVKPEILASVERLRRLFKEKLDLEVSEAKLNSAGKNSVEMVLKNGWSAIFNPEDAESSFASLRTLLEKEIKEKQNELEYVDLRFGSKIYYKFKKTP